MGNLFGVKRRAPQVTAQDRAVLQLKQQRDKIKIYQKRTEADLERNKELALKLYQNNMKERALIVLRRKKYMEDVLARTDKQLETLESLVTDIEFTQIQISVVEGLRVGTEAMKQLNSLMNIDDIHQMLDDSAEAAEKQREISAILSQTSERYDDSDLLEELEQYKQKEEPAIVSNEEQVNRVATNSKMDDKVEEISSPSGHDEPEEDLIPIAQSEQEIFEDSNKLDNLPDVPTNEEQRTVPVKKRKSKSPQREERQLESA